MVEPIKKYRYGQVTATVWENEKENKETKEKYLVQTVALQKQYKDGDEWKESKSFQKNDLQKAILALQDAQKFLMESRIKED